jgi:DNA-directed RNA polymerase subunit RPC12/RpoP
MMINYFPEINTLETIVVNPQGSYSVGVAKKQPQIAKSTPTKNDFQKKNLLHEIKDVKFGKASEEEGDEVMVDAKNRVLITKSKRPQKNEGKRKQYACPYCDRLFNHRQNMYKHRDIHEGKRYNCEVCGKEFVRKIHVKLHMRIHTGERPYKCLLCEKAFSRRFCLNLHMDVHMNLKGGAMIRQTLNG